MIVLFNFCIRNAKESLSMLKGNRPATGRPVLKYIWGAMPVVGLLVIIALLSIAIQKKTDQLAAIKAGVDELYGVQLAVKDIDRVVKTLREAQDTSDAVDRLKKLLNVTDDQAKAIVHLPLNSMVQFQQDKLGKQIAFLEQQIAEKKISAQALVPDVNVVALELSPMPVRDRMNLPGIVEPWVKFNIAAEVRGKVDEKRIEKGTIVRTGDIIAMIDPKDYEIALQAAKASFDTALASKNRLEKLYKEQLASRSQLDDITAQVEQTRAQMDSAALNLERCVIRSPITGMINNLYIEKGQYVKISDPVAEILQMDKVKVVVGIPESDVSALETVNSFQVTLDALNGRTFTAEKHFLSSASDAKARLYNLELRMENPSGEILPDMFARVEIVKKERPAALVVPLYSIITIKNEQLVYVVVDNIVRSKKVRTGIQEGWQMEITDGLASGDRVIVIGHRSVSEGQKVNVVRTVSKMEDLGN
ncbi:MAG: efflux RND transporter periplasmic adaptor subunit [Desulfobacteraceae bacterium]|nr:MAG: efflux RND transporter periplasmic adaptor subunit [Desulfobacteraceae bacterium]